MNQHSTFAERHKFAGEVPATASTLAYRLSNLLKVCVLAEDNDNCPIYDQNGRGLNTTLQLAERWADELTEEIEHLERAAKVGIYARREEVVEKA